MLFKAIYGSVAGAAALVFAVIAAGPTRAIRQNLPVRLVALGGAIEFAALTLEYIGVASFRIVVAPIVVGGVLASVGAVRINRARRKAQSTPDDLDTPHM